MNKKNRNIQTYLITISLVLILLGLTIILFKESLLNDFDAIFNSSSIVLLTSIPLLLIGIFILLLFPIKYFFTSKSFIKDGFWSIIHSQVKKVAFDKFNNKHYADAVESALKEINSKLKAIHKKKKKEELDGVKLMYACFDEENPTLVLDNLKTQSGKNIQKGFKQIFAGAISGIRNPKAHENIKISKDLAIHYLFLASLLMKKIDTAK